MTRSVTMLLPLIFLRSTERDQHCNFAGVSPYFQSKVRRCLNLKFIAYRPIVQYADVHVQGCRIKKSIAVEKNNAIKTQ